MLTIYIHIYLVKYAELQNLFVRSYIIEQSSFPLLESSSCIHAVVCVCICVCSEGLSCVLIDRMFYVAFE